MVGCLAGYPPIWALTWLVNMCLPAPAPNQPTSDIQNLQWQPFLAFLATQTQPQPGQAEMKMSLRLSIVVFGQKVKCLAFCWGLCRVGLFFEFWSQAMEVKWPSNRAILGRAGYNIVPSSENSLDGHKAPNGQRKTSSEAL